MRTIAALTLLSSCLASSAFAAPSIRVAPNPAKPGDAVLIELEGAADQETAPRVQLGEQNIEPYRTRRGWAALAALPVEQAAGELAIDVRFADKQALKHSLEIGAAPFAEVDIDVEEIFVDPPREFKVRIEEDNKLISAAYDRAYTPLAVQRPFQRPNRGRVTSEYGQFRRFNGKRNSQHFGTDLLAKTGDNVVSANDGEVVLVRDCFYSGQTVIVHHGAQLYTAYFHLAKTAVSEGQRIRRGQKIGAAGDSGRTTGPHVHFAVRIGDHYVDPETFLALKLPSATEREKRRG
jgi:murein DD-endopeptidase MepM/ murein hydrolase activator NlpD